MVGSGKRPWWRLVLRFILGEMFVVGALMAWLGVTPLQAQDLNRAGLVVVHGDGQVETRCVAFDQEEITGYDLLAQSGLSLRTDVTSMGTTICSLDGEGCDESSTCFCQCQRSPCIYWSYWQWDGTTWRYANLGASNSTLGDGALEGWVWAEGRIGQDAAIMPPPLRFDEICHADAPLYGVASATSVGLNISWQSLLAGVVVVALPFIVLAILWARRRQV